MIKHIIKHLTCRRRINANPIAHNSRGARTKSWSQVFKKGFVQQAFERAAVRHSLRHGPDNAPHLQRKDMLEASLGIGFKRKRKAGAPLPPPMRDLVSAPTVPTFLQSKAL